MMKPPKAEITIRISIDTLEAIEDGISAAIRDIKQYRQITADQERRLSLLWDCRQQIDTAMENKLKEFSLYDVEARQRFDERDKLYRKIR